MTIIRNFRLYHDYPYEAVDSHFLAIWDFGLESSNSDVKHSAKHAIICIECYLQVTGKKLKVSDLNGAKLSTLYGEIIEAIYDDVFLQATFNKRYYLASAVSFLFDLLAIKYNVVFMPNYTMNRYRPPDGLQGKDFLKANDLIEERVFFWKGWPTLARSGNEIWLPFHISYEKLGYSFTKRLYQSIDDYATSRKIDNVRGVRDLCKFISTSDKIKNCQDLQGDYAKHQFWPDFLFYYLRSNYSNGASINFLMRSWNREVRKLAQNYICAENLIAPPARGFPMIPAHAVLNQGDKVGGNADSRNGRNLSEIPLYVSDEEAISLLANTILADIENLMTWARQSVEVQLQRVKRRLSEAAYTDQNSALNLAKIIEDVDSVSLTKNQQFYIGRKRREITKAYGVASPQSLIPFCAILVYNHPEITPAFLEQLILFDSNGCRKNLTTVNGKTVIKSYKYRKGHMLAEQTIVLSDEAAYAVEGIITITDSARRSLVALADPACQYLLITTGRSLSKPYRIKRLASLTSGHFIEGIAESISEICQVDVDYSQALASRFSLRTLRASMGIKKYLETNSMAAVAKVLGHAQVDVRLMDAYLPGAIVDFFRDRWIRIFQVGIILQSMKDSDHLLFVTQLTTNVEVDLFLKQHGIDYSQLAPSCETVMKADGELVVGISVELLIFFLQLQRPIVGFDAQRSFMARLGQEIINDITNKSEIRPDLYSKLEIARSREYEAGV